MSMVCYVCGKRATKVRVLYKTRYDLCQKHNITDLVRFEWLNFKEE